MLDSLYQDIGKKIKLWAKWIFIVEAIGAVVTGVSILINGGEVVLALLTIVLGPCVALVSTWLLYAAGEAVDKICDIERNTRPAAQIDTSAGEAVDKICDIERNTKPTAQIDTSAGIPQNPVSFSATKPTVTAKQPDVTCTASTASGWTCSCGKINASYVSTCTCGQSKHTVADQ